MVQASAVEVTYSMYGLGSSNCCPDGELYLDGTLLAEDTNLSDPTAKSGFVDLVKFKTTQAHAMKVLLQSSSGSTGSTGAAILILYDAP